MTYSSKKAYRRTLKTALDDAFLRQSLNTFSQNYLLSRQKLFSGKDPGFAIEQLAAMKSRSVSQMTALFEQFQKKAEKLGAKVHYAEDADAANRIIERIAKVNGVKKIAKSKSMTSEEIFLNAHLEKCGYQVTETDLGEWIIQLRKEKPSHMVLPAIHLSRHQVAELFSEVIKDKVSHDIPELVQLARKELRKTFLEADMGITGANFAIAGSGTLGLVTNEGNARLLTTLPRVHVALVGMEKLVENLSDALKIIELLPKNATCQPITSYVTWITGSTKQTHIVFLNNGRKQLANDPVFSEVLHCIRCGACANVCPVYGNIGGHAMGYVYVGPVGLILTYLYHGEEKARHLADNCLNCLACEEICASGIRLPRLIVEVQDRLKRPWFVKTTSRTVGNLIASRKVFHAALIVARKLQGSIVSSDGFIRHLPMALHKKHAYRTLPKLASEPFYKKWERLRQPPERSKMRVALFTGCLNEFVYPEQLENAVKLLNAHHIELVYLEQQNCCGLPLMMLGDKTNLRKLIKQNIRSFAEVPYDAILTLCASCASFIRESYPKEAEPEIRQMEELNTFVSRIMDLRTLLDIYVSLPEQTKKKQRITYHAPCHLHRGLKVKKDPGDLIRKAGYDYVPDPMERNCCGFGGTYSLKFPDISKAQLKKKISSAKETGAEIMVTECPGCVMQLRGGADHMQAGIQVKHLSELFQMDE